MLSEIATLEKLETLLSKPEPQRHSRNGSALEAYFEEINYSSFGNGNSHAGSVKLAKPAPINKNYSATIKPVDHRREALEYTLSLY